MLLALVGVAILLWRQGVFQQQQNERTNILVLGLDQVGEAKRSDAILIASIKEGDVKVISIPRDLRVKFPDGRLRKINAAYADGGVGLTRKVVSDFLDIPVHFHIITSYEGFEQIIDLLGGVTLTIEKPLKYEDKAQKLFINLPAGTQKLTGKQALDYVRFRDETGDWGRIKRQQALIKALLAKGIQLKDFDTLKGLIAAAYRYIDTNMALIDMYELAKKLMGLREDQVALKQIPARPVTAEGVNFLEPDIVKTAELVSELIKGIDVLTNSDIKVCVLNGNGVEGFARRVGELLAAEDFEVVHIGNADHFDYKQSYIVNVGGDERKAKRLEAELRGRMATGAIQIVKPEELGKRLEVVTRGLDPKGVDLIFIGGKDFELKK